MKATIKSFFKDKYNVLFLLAIVIGFIVVLNSGKEKYPFSDFRQIILYKVTVFTLLISLLPFYYIKKDPKYALVIFVTMFTLCAILIQQRNNVFNNIGGDFWYYNSLITKYKYYSEWLIDSTIKGIPSYLSPLFFFVVGKFAGLFDLSPSNALIIFTFLGVFSMPLLYFYLLKESFDRFVVLLTIIIGCIFFQYDLIGKPYQSISALMALIFFYKFLPKVENWSNYKVNLWVAIFGVLLFLTYHYHFLYLGMAFFLDILFKNYTQQSENKKQIWRRFGIYMIIFVGGFLFYILPNIIAIIKAGSSHTIHYGATEDLDLMYLAFPMVLGLFDVLRNIHKPYAFRTLVLISALTLLFTLNLFTEAYLKSNLYVFKIYHIVSLIMLPHAVNFVCGFVFQETEKRYENLVRAFIITVLLVYSLNEWTVYNFNYKMSSNRGANYIDNREALFERVQKAVDLKDKVLFFPDYSANQEYGAILPNFRFLPINSDYGSFASRVTERVKVVESLDSVKFNPAAFAYKLMNNKIQSIDYLVWTDGSNKLTWKYPAKLGESFTPSFETPLSKLAISERYFEKVKNVKDLYRVKHENNFIDKNPDSLTFLEKVALGKITGDYYQRFLKEQSRGIVSYNISDIQDVIYYLRSTGNIAESQIDSVIKLAPKGIEVYSFEAEDMRCGVTGREINFSDNHASGKYCRRISYTPNTAQGALIFGPYVTLFKGKYLLKLYIKSNKNSDDEVFRFNIGSSKGIVRSASIPSKEVYSTDNYILVTFPFELAETVDNLEVVGYYNDASKAELSIDKYEIVTY